MKGRVVKVPSEQRLAVIIEIATQHVEDPDVKNSIISKCHVGIGMLVAGMPTQARATIELNDREITALSDAVCHWRRQKK